MRLPQPHPAFQAKKTKILSQLSIPDAEYTDASPKGSVDEGIRDLIDEINSRNGLVTTSSCAGRVSIFVEGSKTSRPSAEDESDKPKPASAVGGKGGGGTWLFVSHDPVDEAVLNGDVDVAALFGLDDSASDGGSVGDMLGGSESRLIHFKFEPMILHILTSSPYHAQLVLKCGLAAGFRESGAVSLLETSSRSGGGEPATPMVAIRSMGLSFESLVGVMDSSGRKRSIVSPEYLRMLVRIGNERFVENGKRIGRFLEALRAEVIDDGEDGGMSRVEEKEARREMKRAEGLRRQAEARERRGREKREEVEAYIDDLAEDTNLS